MALITIIMWARKAVMAYDALWWAPNSHTAYDAHAALPVQDTCLTHCIYWNSDIELESNNCVCQIMNGSRFFHLLLQGRTLWQVKTSYTSLTASLLTRSLSSHNHSLPLSLNHCSPIHSLTYLPIYSLTASLTGTPAHFHCSLTDLSLFVLYWLPVN